MTDIDAPGPTGSPAGQPAPWAAAIVRDHVVVATMLTITGTPPTAGDLVVPLGEAAIGWTWDGKSLHPPLVHGD